MDFNELILETDSWFDLDTMKRMWSIMEERLPESFCTDSEVEEFGRIVSWIQSKKQCTIPLNEETLH